MRVHQGAFFEGGEAHKLQGVAKPLFELDRLKKFITPKAPHARKAFLKAFLKEDPVKGKFEKLVRKRTDS